MTHAIIVLIIILMNAGVEKRVESLLKNKNKIKIDNISNGWIAPIIADLMKPIFVVLHSTKVLIP